MGKEYDTVEVPREVLEEAIRWAREAGGPAYDESEEWCKPMADLVACLGDEHA